MKTSPEQEAVVCVCVCVWGGVVLETERLFRIIKQLIKYFKRGPYPMCNASLAMTWIQSTYKVCLIIRDHISCY